MTSRERMLEAAVWLGLSAHEAKQEGLLEKAAIHALAASVLRQVAEAKTYTYICRVCDGPAALCDHTKGNDIELIARPEVGT